jgi:hypothetical protein
MHVQRTMKVLAISATVAALGSVVACAPAGRHAETGVSVSASWDSGPLDRDYARKHAELEARHNREIANPEHGESKYDMDKRHSNENYTLEVRYKQGKESHADVLPPS